MAASQLALMEPSLFVLMEQHPLSVWWEEEEDRVVALLEAVEDAVVVVVVVDVVVLDARLVTPLKKTLTKTQMKTLTKTTTGAMAGTMTMTMTLTMTMTMTMTMIMTIDSDVLEVVEGVVLVVLPAVALMGLDHHARTTRGQPRVLTAPHQPGFHLARLEGGHDAPTNKGLSAPMAPDPTTGSAKTQTDPHAPTELLLSALTAARLPQSQFVQTPLMLSFSGLKGGSAFQGTAGDLFYMVLASNWHEQENLKNTELGGVIFSILTM